MQAWWSGTTYYWTGTYLGGVSNCTYQPGSWMSSVITTGFAVGLIWDGAQPPCNAVRNTMPWSGSSAYSTGVSNADQAVNAAVSKGFGSGTPIYTDVEGFTDTIYMNQHCVDSVRAYVSGWTVEIAARGFAAGYYGSSSGSYVEYMAGASHVPPYI